MEFFAQAVNVLKILVMAVGAGLGAWGVIVVKSYNKIEKKEENEEE